MPDPPETTDRGSFPSRLWARLPAVVRAVVVAFLILSIGQLPPGVFLLAGLKLTPAVPWFLLATALWLWWFWRFLSGHGRPSATARQRQEDLRAHSLSGRVWGWSLLAGGLGMVSVMSLGLLTGRIGNLPLKAYEAPFDVSPYPAWTVLAIFLNLAVVAGVVEEAAFRGYLLSRIQRRHGWALGIVGAAVLFFLAHLGHAYVTMAFLPFFMLYSLLHGVLVLLTRSILPSVVLHALGDFAVLPIQYGAIPSPLGSRITAHVLVIVACGIASAAAFRRLVADRRQRDLQT